MLTPPPDNNLSNQDKSPTRTSPRAPWVLILPLALAAGVLLQQSQNDEPPAQNVATNFVANSAPTSIDTPTPTDDKLRGKPAKYVLFVPDDNGDLRRETVIDKTWKPTANDFATDSKNVRAEAATRAVKTLMRRHADDFPKGAQLENASIGNDDITTLNFNSAFNNGAFWQGETRVLASVYALVNTAIASQKSVNGESGKDKVTLQVEGKSLDTLGELDTREPLATDMKMVAQAVSAR